MDRRNFIATGIAAIFAGHSAAFKNLSEGDAPQLTAEPDYHRHVTILPQMVGCIGKSTNPLVTEYLLTQLKKSPCDQLSHEPAIKGNMKLVLHGSFPEFQHLKDEYKAKTQSELLLNLLMSGNQECTDGAKAAFSHINYADYSAALQAVSEDSEELWLMKDDQSPRLHVVDMRSTLGQVFFFPLADDWRAAVRGINGKNGMPLQAEMIPNGQTIIQFPQSQVWKFQYKEGVVTCTNKFKVIRTKYVNVGDDLVPPSSV